MMSEGPASNKGKQPLNKEELSRLFFISFGVFLFILFFQPFPLDGIDNNNRLLFETGFGAITFAAGCLIFVVLPLLVKRQSRTTIPEDGPPPLLYFAHLLITVTSFAFYIRYVGMISLTLNIIFMVFLVSLLPLLILILLHKNKSLEYQVLELQEQLRSSYRIINDKEPKGKEEKIVLSSENGNDRISLLSSNIFYINSADNYIEINYSEKGISAKKLLRNTLKNAELALSKNPHFMRCHRTCIININCVDKMQRNYSGYTLHLRDSGEVLPVSRQYVIQIREALASGKEHGHSPQKR